METETLSGTHLSKDVQAELPHLHRYALSLTRDPDRAEDLVQDCIVRALSNERKYEHGTHLRRWLFTILRNLNIDHHRRASRRHASIALDEGEVEIPQPASQEDHLELQEVYEKIRALRPCDRKILYLSVCTTLRQAEIASRMQIAVGTVKSRLSRARQMLAA